MTVKVVITVLALAAAVVAVPQLQFGNDDQEAEEEVGERLGLLGASLGLPPTGEVPSSSQAAGQLQSGQSPAGRSHSQCCCVPRRTACSAAFGRENEDLVGQGLIDPRLTNQTSAEDIGNRIANFPGAGNPEPPKTCPAGDRICCYDTDQLDLGTFGRSTCRAPAAPRQEPWHQKCDLTGPRQGRGRQCGTRSYRTAPGLAHAESSPGEFPWTCILINGNNDFVGSCALIPSGFHNDNSRGQVKVITAAHKLGALQEYDELIVRVGEWDASGFKNPESARHQEYTVKRILKHRDMSTKRLSYDLAILYTARPIQLNDQDRLGNYQVNTACLPSCRDQFSHRFSNGTGTRCWVAGWGKDRDNGEFQVRQKKVDLPLMDDASCQAGLKAALEARKPGTGRRFSLHRSEICAGGERGKDACTGDGGSPLVCQAESGRWTVVGVVTWGVGCASTTPGVYARIADFQRWIDAN